ncbi:MAG: RagB/SusD family nutrient uptake outer membrane protein, partial [Bacteroidales bacterium]|nr:RagB/SusD family nutrient uptake outer membrane protein [Bacteroidales bacterium]
MKRFSLISLSVVMALAAFTLTACDNFLDITPTGKVIAKTGEEYRALLTYEYKYFAKDRYTTTVRTDEILMDKNKSSSSDLEAYLDLWRWKDDNPSPTTTYFYWRNYYHAIYISNYIIEHQDEITESTTAQIHQLVGESYMMRAYAHFLLVNLYAEDYSHCTPATTRGIPMLLQADVNAIPASSSVEAVYQQVLADIAEAEKYLNVEKWEAGENYRFNKISAQALRARVFLYIGDWQKSL